MSSRTTRILGSLALWGVTAALSALPASASSDFRTGTLGTQNPLSRGDVDAGVCRLFIGPRDEIGDGEFLLRIGDLDPQDGSDALELRGTAVADGHGSFRLSADRAAAQDFYEQVLRVKLHRSTAEFNLSTLRVTVSKSPDDIGADTITCALRLTGSLVATGGVKKRSATGAVTLAYQGAGLFFAGIAPAAPDVSEAQAASDPAGSQCAIPNLTPRPEFCDTPGCLVSFAGYQWWTEYDFFSAEAPPGSSGFWNNNNLWSPRNVTVDAEGLHLFVRQQDTLNDKGQCCVHKWTAGEAVTAKNPDGSVAVLGYGTYLVAARLKTAPTWDAMDPNVAFGLFTYERNTTGNSQNPGRELDLAEVSRWGRQDGVPCRIDPSKLCNGNSQFTLQIWSDGGASLPNLFRYTIAGPPGNELTLVMDWPGAGQPVTFRQYNGLFTLATLPASAPNNQWTTPASQNPWVPATGCQQFHMNLWMGNFTGAANGFNPPPASGAPQEVVVTNFQYQPAP